MVIGSFLNMWSLINAFFIDNMYIWKVYELQNVALSKKKENFYIN